MQVDRATLRDLSILDPGEEGASLFSLLDRTRTRLGNAALRARLKTLPSSADVRATQDAVRHLSTRIDSVRSALDAIDPDGVDEYLSLKWQALTKRSPISRFIERLMLRLSYQDAVRQIHGGVAKLVTLLDGLQPILDATATGPESLGEWARKLKELTDAGPVADLRRHARARSLARILDADSRARGPARDRIREVLSMLAELDALCALASATLEHRWCFPEFTESDGVLDLRGLRHAQLPDGVPNDMILDGQRVLALTGPNMAGKSTLLKAIGTAVYLAHLGCGVPASRGRMSCFDALFASLYVRDSLSAGQSYYLGEVRRIRDLMEILASTPRVVALLDEPFKGTNVVDAAEATALLVDGLCAQEASAVVIATHLASVVEARMHDECLVTSYLGATDTNAGFEFDYRLQPGVSEQHLGMVLLHREGVGQALTSAIAQRSRRADAT